MSTLKTHNLQSPDAGSVNIVMAPNSGMVVAGLSTYSNQINVGSNIKLGTAGVVTATSFVGSGANLTSLPSQITFNNASADRILTSNGGTAVNAEANLTFDGNNLNQTIDNSGEGIRITAPNNHYSVLRFDSNASSANGSLCNIQGHWNGNEVAVIIFSAGSDTTNKDDGYIRMYTRESGQSNTERVRINSDGKIGIATDTGNGLINTRHAGTNQQVLHFRSDLGSNNNRTFNLYTPDTDSTETPFRFQTGNGFLFQCDNENVFTIAHDRRVGITESSPDTKLHITHGTAGEEVLKIEASPVTADTGAKSKIIFQITQSNNQSARLAEIHSLAENGWGGGLAINVKPSNSVPQNTTMEALRINSSDSAAANLRMVVDAYLQMGGYNNTNESFANLCTLFSARDMAGSSMVSGQTDTISGYARRRITSDGSGTFFFGPYGAFPAGDYTALFRLKVSDRSGSSGIGYIDIIGNGIGIQGRNTAPRTGTGQSVNMSLQTNDFTASNTYQYFALDFSKSNSAAHIECRFLSYAANVDVYLDHILIVPRLNHGVEGVSGMFDY